MGIIAAFCIALMITLLFSAGNNNSFAFLGLIFLILFLSILAGYFWIIPFGPFFWGIAWMPLFFVGIISAFFLMIPSQRSRKKIGDIRVNDYTSSEAAISIFFWFLLLALLIAVLAGYYRL